MLVPLEYIKVLQQCDFQGADHKAAAGLNPRTINDTLSSSITNNTNKEVKEKK